MQSQKKPRIIFGAYFENNDFQHYGIMTITTPLYPQWNTNLVFTLELRPKIAELESCSPRLDIIRLTISNVSNSVFTDIFTYEYPLLHDPAHR